MTEKSQREFQPAHAAKLAADFKLEGMGFPTVSHRGGHFYIVDGQHRIHALRLLEFSPDDLIQCEVYENLSEEDEAELFLERNTVLAVAPLDKFRVALNAKRQREIEVDRIVRAQGLNVSREKSNGVTNISAVGTLLRVYDRSGSEILGRALRIIRDAYGAPGFEQSVIAGTALFCDRYDGQFDEAQAVDRLGSLHGGVHGLLGAAHKLVLSTGNAKAQCVAAAITDAYNAGKGKKLANWWRA